MESVPSPMSAPPDRSDRPWSAFADQLTTIEDTLNHQGRPLKIRVRWEVYDHTKQRYVHVKGSAFVYSVRQRTTTLAERLWRAVQVVLG